MKKRNKSIKIVYRQVRDKRKLLESYSTVQIMENWVKIFKTGKLCIKYEERKIKPERRLPAIMDLYLEMDNTKELDEFYDAIMASEEALGQDIVKNCFDKYREHGFWGYWENNPPLPDDEKPD